MDGPDSRLKKPLTVEIDLLLRYAEQLPRRNGVRKQTFLTGDEEVTGVMAMCRHPLHNCAARAFNEAERVPPAGLIKPLPLHCPCG